MNHLPRFRVGHTFEPGQCRDAVHTGRRFALRVGHHPRGPARPASAEPTARSPGHVPDAAGELQELGREGEEHAIRSDERRQAEVREGHAQPATADDMGRPSDPGAASSSDPAGSIEARHRGPDLHPRIRRTWTDTGTGPADSPDWTAFDIGRTVKALKVCTPVQARLSLRKLHLRWWHAQAATMTRILRRAGVPKQVCDLIPEIVSTCTSCRAWSRPLPASVASVELADSFNQQVECDLMFVFSFIIFHMIDRCARWHAACLVPTKEDTALVDALNAIWVGIHGPMIELIMDGEVGLAVSGHAKQYYDRHGIQFIPRAKEQQVAHIDRRGALLRDTLHRVTTQCETEGLEIEFKQILSECVFCGNAMLSINGSTPYNAAYGRVPALLPDANLPSDDAAPGTVRHVQQMREISIQAMVEGTAQARVRRALGSKARSVGQSYDYKIGDLVDFHRAPSAKYVSGWKALLK